MKENKVTIEISGTTKPWVGKITGRDPKYGFALDFVRSVKRISARYHKIDITEPGIYRVPTPDVAKVSIPGWRVDSGFLRISEDGAATEITKADAELAFPSDPKNN
jgi:hypothetical protein